MKQQKAEENQENNGKSARYFCDWDYNSVGNEQGLLSTDFYDLRLIRSYLLSKSFRFDV